MKFKDLPKMLSLMLLVAVPKLLVAVRVYIALSSLFDC